MRNNVCHGPLMLMMLCWKLLSILYDCSNVVAILFLSSTLVLYIFIFHCTNFSSLNRYVHYLTLSDPIRVQTNAIFWCRRISSSLSVIIYSYSVNVLWMHSSQFFILLLSLSFPLHQFNWYAYIWCVMGGKKLHSFCKIPFRIVCNWVHPVWLNMRICLNFMCMRWHVDLRYNQNDRQTTCRVHVLLQNCWFDFLQWMLPQTTVACCSFATTKPISYHDYSVLWDCLLRFVFGFDFLVLANWNKFQVKTHIQKGGSW